MNKILIAGLAACALLTACESGPTIRTNVDPAANLASYRTYAFPEKVGTDRPGYSTPISSYFKEAIRREMDNRGYKFVEGSTADLLVNFNANARENVDVRTTPGSTYGMGYGYYGYKSYYKPYYGYRYYKPYYGYRSYYRYY